MTNLAGVYRLQGKFAEAEPLFAAAVEAGRRSAGDQHPDTLDKINNLATTYLAQHKYAEAEALLRAALTTFEKRNVDRWERFYARTLLGESLAGMKKYAEAERCCFPCMKACLPGRERFLLSIVRAWNARAT